MSAAKSSSGPHFIGIGAMKCATTWIEQCLAEHPRVVRAAEIQPDGSTAPLKEVHFFDSHYDRGTEWYENLFRHPAPDQVCGEYSPRYLFHPEVAERIAQHYPQAKLIVSLRNPIDRAISQYHYTRDVLGGRDFHVRSLSRFWGA